VRRGREAIRHAGDPGRDPVFFGKSIWSDTGYNDPLDVLVPGVLALAVMSPDMSAWGSPPASSAATGSSNGWAARRSVGPASSPPRPDVRHRGGIRPPSSCRRVVSWAVAGRGDRSAVLVMIMGTTSPSTARASHGPAPPGRGHHGPWPNAATAAPRAGGMAYPLAKVALALQDIARVYCPPPRCRVPPGAMTGVASRRPSVDSLSLAVLAPAAARSSAGRVNTRGAPPPEDPPDGVATHTAPVP